MAYFTISRISYSSDYQKFLHKKTDENSSVVKFTFRLFSQIVENLFEGLVKRVILVNTSADYRRRKIFVQGGKYGFAEIVHDVFSNALFGFAFGGDVIIYPVVKRVHRAEQTHDHADIDGEIEYKPQHVIRYFYPPYLFYTGKHG
jgi:hypothetical protein